MTSLLSWLYYGSSTIDDTKPDPPAEIGTWTLDDMRAAMATGDIEDLERKARKFALFDAFTDVGLKCCAANTRGPIEGGAVLFLGGLLQIHTQRATVALFVLRLLHCLAPQLSCAQLELLTAPLCQTLRHAHGIPAVMSAKGRPETLTAAEHEDRIKAAVFAPYYAAVLLLKVSCEVSLPAAVSNLIAEVIETRYSGLIAQLVSSAASAAAQGSSSVSGNPPSASSSSQVLSVDQEQLARHEMRLLSCEVKSICRAIQRLGCTRAALDVADSDVLKYSNDEHAQLCMWLRVLAVVGDAMHPKDVAIVLCTLTDVCRDRVSISRGSDANDEAASGNSNADGSQAARPFTAVAKALAARAIGLGWQSRRLPATDMHLDIFASVLGLAETGLPAETKWLFVEVLRAVGHVFETTCHVTTLEVFAGRMLECVLARVTDATTLSTAAGAAAAAHVAREALATYAAIADVLPRVRCLSVMPGAIAGVAEKADETDDVGFDDCDDDEGSTRRGTAVSLAWREVVIAATWQLQRAIFAATAQVERSLGLQRNDEDVEPLPHDTATIVDALRRRPASPSTSSAADAQSAPPVANVSAHQIWGELLYRSTSRVCATAIIPKRTLRGRDLLLQQNRLKMYLNDILEIFLPSTRSVNNVAFLLFSVLQNSVAHDHMNGEEPLAELPRQFDFAPALAKLLQRMDTLAQLAKTTGQILAQAGGITTFFTSGGGLRRNPAHPSPALNKLTIEAVNTALLKTLVFLTSMRCTHRAAEISDDERRARLLRWQLVGRELVHLALRFLEVYEPVYDQACADVLQQLCDPVKPTPVEVLVEDVTDDDEAPPEQSVMITTIPVERPTSKEELIEREMLVSVAPPESLLVRQLQIVAAACQRHKGWVYNGEVVAKLAGIFDRPSNAELLLRTPLPTAIGTTHFSSGGEQHPSVIGVLCQRFDVMMALRPRVDRALANAVMLLVLRKRLPRWMARELIELILPPLRVKNGESFLAMLYSNR